MKAGTRLRVVKITNNIDSYPEAVEDTAAFPHLVDRVEDEYDLFIVDEETGEWWVADEFFQSEEVRYFRIEE